MTLIHQGVEPVAGPRRRRIGRLAMWAVLAVLAVLVGFRWFVVEPVTVVSNSMAPTIHAGDRVLIETAGFVGGSVERGDLVTFHAGETDQLTLKRVSGLPGDTVAIRDGWLVVNGGRVDEAYLDHRSVDGLYFGPVTVPADTVFVLGDNRADSEDSRDFGPVPESDLVGTVIQLW